MSVDTSASDRPIAASPSRWSTIQAGLAQNSLTSVTATLVITAIVGAIWAGPIFLSSSNLGILGEGLAIPLLVGTFAAVGLLGGCLDLSIGSHIGFAAAMFSHYYVTGTPTWRAVLITLAASAIVGLVNAVAIVFFNGNPITITLGMLTLLQGAALVVLGKARQIDAFSVELFTFTARRLGPVPVLLIIALGVVLVATIAMTLLRIGRHIRAIGGDPRASERAGLAVRRLQASLYILVALGAGIGGILYSWQLGGASATLGFGLEFQIYAGVLIGGFSLLRGGIGNPAGAALGMLVIAAVDNLLRLKGTDINVSFLVLGLLLLGAILLDRLRGGERFD